MPRADKRGRHATNAVPLEKRTTRLTILVNADKKKLFEKICAGQDLTPSQGVRWLIRQYILGNAGNRPLPPWLEAAASRSGGHSGKTA